MLNQQINAELCPPIFGEFECPEKYTCVLGACKGENGQTPPEDCDKITCHMDSRCSIGGKCLPFEGMPCGRNVLIAEKTAEAIVSDCGRRGKCVSGKCVIDKCMEMLCDEGEVCRDGKCQKLISNFCFSDFDCGQSAKSGLHCKANKCEKSTTMDSEGIKPTMKCDPGESPQNDRCVPQDGCAQLVCELGETCLNGFCIPTTIECGDPQSTFPGSMISLSTCPDNMICRNRVCIRDPCLDRCPPEHTCINGGECRLLQGLHCIETCPSPFECVNGVCVKDECHRKVCQLGERCDGGICVRIQGKICKNAERDCGESFDCVNSACQDKITLMESRESNSTGRL
ncbi:teneurin-3 [Ditylenchus destructor]|nr:teneurin-3 [Ditylenchus destructor]